MVWQECIGKRFRWKLILPILPMNTTAMDPQVRGYKCTSTLELYAYIVALYVEVSLHDEIFEGL